MSSIEDFLTGYDLAIKNAKSLLNIANKSAEEKEFGIACSLNILSAEESIKAVFLLIKHYFSNPELSDFDKIFKDHKIKHKNLKPFIEILVKHITDITKMYMVFLEAEQYGRTFLKANRQEELDKEFSDLHYHGKRIYELHKSEISIEKAIAWLESANDSKNNGFYVGFIGNKWQAPTQFESTKFEEEKIYSALIIQYVIEFEELLKLTFRSKE